MALKDIYERFRAWQKKPFTYKKDREQHVCANCGNTFTGRYCPSCGQKSTEGRVCWKSVWEDLKTLLKINDPVGTVSYFTQLFGRTGYMIDDYISGRKQVIASPVKKLLLFAVFAALVQGKTGRKMEYQPIAEGSKMEFMNNAFVWLSSNLSWAIIFQTALIVFPTWLLFRHAPKHTKHTLPEGIYIQICMCSLVLIFVMLRSLVGDWVLMFIPVFYCIAYGQIFGYGVWGTIWRTFLSLGIIFYFFAVIMMTVKDIQLSDLASQYPKLVLALQFVFFILLGFGVLTLGWWIGKKGEKKRTTKAQQTAEAEAPVVIEEVKKG